MSRQDQTKRALGKAAVVLLMALLIALYLWWEHANVIATTGFILAGLAFAVVIYLVNRPREQKNPSF